MGKVIIKGTLVYCVEGGENKEIKERGFWELQRLERGGEKSLVSSENPLKSRVHPWRSLSEGLGFKFLKVSSCKGMSYLH